MTRGDTVCLVCSKSFSGGETACPEDGTRLVSVGQGSELRWPVPGYSQFRLESSGLRGDVYSGQRDADDKPVVMRLTRVIDSQIDQALVQLGLLRSLSNPGIVPTLDFGAFGGNLFHITESRDGKTLQSMIESRQRYSLCDLEVLFEPVFQALSYAHNHGVLHRNICPASILITDDGAKITGFMVPAQLQPAISQLEPMGLPDISSLGVLYMSPEKIQGTSISEPSDIYSLACVIYEAITGFPPFRGNVVTDIAKQHLEDSPALFSSVIPEGQILLAVQIVLFTALEKYPSARYKTVGEFKRAFGEACESLQSCGAASSFVLPLKDLSSGQRASLAKYANALAITAPSIPAQVPKNVATRILDLMRPPVSISTTWWEAAGAALAGASVFQICFRPSGFMHFETEFCMLWGGLVLSALHNKSGYTGRLFKSLISSIVLLVSTGTLILLVSSILGFLYRCLTGLVV